MRQRHNTIRGQHLIPDEVLSPVLTKWQRINENLAVFDAPWWYNERATLGILAGAIWKCNGWVYEEFMTKKRLSQKQKDIYDGRCDITFGIDEQTSYWGEAKQCWPHLNDKPLRACGVITQQLDIATKEVKAGIARGYKGLAIVFAVPMFKYSSGKRDTIDDCIVSFIDRLITTMNVTLAWTFPKNARYMRPSAGMSFHDYYFPGIVVALKRVKGKL